MQPARSTCTDWAGASFRQLKEVEKMRLQRHKKTSGKEAEQLAVGREGGCRGDNAACAPGRFDGHEGGRSHGQGLEHTLSMHAHGRVACRRATGLVAAERLDEAEQQGRWPEVRTSLPRPGIIVVGQHRYAHASAALPKPLACPHI